MNPEELEFIRSAAAFLEDPGIFIKTVNLLGRPIEKLQARLPGPARSLITRAARFSLEQTLRAAIGTIAPPEIGTSASPESGAVAPPENAFAAARLAADGSARAHGVATAVSGALGGALGLAGLPLELPVTTLLMQRSIARIAADFGEDLASPETRLECLYIFTLGTPSPADDASDTAYYASRFGFAELVREAATFLARGAAARGTAPVLVRLLANVAARFEIAVTEKALAGAVPLLGAAGGALINTAFTGFFNRAARYHFGLKRLERLHGREHVQATYRSFVTKKGP